MKKTVFLLTVCSGALGFAVSAQVQRNDMNVIVNAIPKLPVNIENWKDSSIQQNQLDPSYYLLKGWIADIHREAILRKMQTITRKDFPDSVVFEDERWKLALRPMLGTVAKEKVLKLENPSRSFVLKILELQTRFDWVRYYEADEKIKNNTRAKIATLNLENSLENVRKKLDLQKDLYKQQRALWATYFAKYSDGIGALQQLLVAIQYGDLFNVREQSVILPLLKDVQARALESIEKMIWSEMQLVISAELLFNDLQILEVYSRES